MKRVLSLMLALILVLSVFTLCPVAAYATETEATEFETEVREPEAEPVTETEPEETEPEETETEETEPKATNPPSGEFVSSDNMIELLKFEEGFCRYPVWDYSQYTVGYGTRCPDSMLAYYRANGITEAEAETLLRNTLANTEYLINKKLIEKYDLDMTQNQFDALVLFSYNMGPGWITSPSQNIHQQVVAGATGNTIIDALSRWCKAGGQVKSFLVRRRLSESYMYIEGKYAHTPPSNYCYVLYNGNGGSTSQSVQGYNADYKGAPTGGASHSSYNFAGWYTSPTGGVKVEVLTEEYNKTTLYAHWEGVSYQEPELFDEPITVTVTANSVNLRKGPGTNYATVGTAKAGQKLDIWQVEKGTYTWGYYKAGWIALDYTNYEDVIAGETTDPTEPEGTEPEETQPEATNPTEPEPTEPEEPQPAKKIIGIVNADPYLCVRKGPGTAYATVDTLRTGERVEITEQKTVGSMIWGKISNGWISMSYVTILDENESEMDQNTSAAGKTGTVTCSLLNVRYGAGVGYSIVGTYRRGDKVTITEQKTVNSTTWGKTAKGWVSMDYIKLDEASNSDQPSGGTGGTTDTGSGDEGTTTQQVTGTVISNDVLRIRSGAGVSFGVVGYLQPGTKVTILEQKTVGATTWGRISKGWISLDYVKLDSESSGDSSLPEDEFDDEETSQVRTVNVSCLLVRSGPGTSYATVSYLYRGAKVTVTETTKVGNATWGKIANGWICLDYTI